MKREKVQLDAEESEPSDSPPSFEEVVEVHWDSVFRLLLSLTNDTHNTEDLTQETFLRAYRRFDSFKPGTNLRAWLMRIATNAFFDVKRKQKTLKIQPLEQDVASEEKSPEDVLNLAEQGDAVRIAMQELTELTRLVFHLRVTEQMSFKAIAKIAELTEVAARQHMHQARVKLLKRLSDSSQ